jgi:hypothetical protein
MQGRQVRRVNIFTAQEIVIAELPPGWVTAFTHVSTDDKLLCIPIVPAAAFEGEEESHWGLAVDKVPGRNGFSSIRDRIDRLRLESLLWVVATDGISQRVWATQHSWITHVQFRPPRQPAPPVQQRSDSRPSRHPTHLDVQRRNRQCLENPSRTSRPTSKELP